MAPRFRLHHAPRSRAFRILWVLEELGAPYERVPHVLQHGTQKAPDFLAINPDGKLPALEDRGPNGDWAGVVVTESGAICAYLADAMELLAPPIGTPDRAIYAIFLAYAGAVLEPAMTDVAFARKEAPPPSTIGWASFDDGVARVERQITASGGPYLLGQDFTMADAMCGGLLRFAAGFGMFKPGPVTAGYLAALEERPAMVRAKAIEDAAQKAAEAS
ncbi:glutathione S-transferase [Roseomonas terrae]|jgi:glutathione S-transferase|uniref:Glutathione S-transferase n=1 Tax=Neoroseomonas terrae TaxID=424799 RepID=A0ABS5EJE3_9PROT|nr:glutathione S-transferase [Neoroseomonas terrae]MBR0651128.1 glutathione S-transferase [Neoroseomonas terrae]